jgi:predicted flap endonuclease-1-like 5' DNA nuclease
MSFTINQWAILALVFVLGWLLGLLSRSDRNWRRRYEEERAAHHALRTDHDARIQASNARIADLERHEPAVGAGTAGAVAAAASGRHDDLTRINGIGAHDETRLNDAGLHGYRDLATLTREQESAIEARLGYEPGRIEREQWREQAAQLARGQATGTHGTETRRL